MQMSLTGPVPAYRALLFLVLFVVLTVGQVPVSRAGLPLGDSIAPMLDELLPGVVNISTTSVKQVRRTNPLFSDPFFKHFFDLPDQKPRTKKSHSLGSGVIIDADKGWIVTNAHVIEGADEINVTLRDRRQFKAKVLGADPEVDVALVQIEAEGLTRVMLGDSEALRVGDFVVAIGNPFGLGQTVTSGIVSALGRSGLGIEGYEDFIQTDASINPGNSGGALVTLDGRLVGINTAIVGPSGGNVGIGFAIPVNMVKSIIGMLAEHGEVKRGQLGVSIQDITPDLAKAFDLEDMKGAVVAQIVKGSPAEKAGLRQGDVILAINGRAVENGSELRNAVGVLAIGTEVVLDLLRDGEKRQVKAVIGAVDETAVAGGKINNRLAGASLGEISEKHPLVGRVEGVQVMNVEEGSPAAQAGLRKDDIITSINRQAVTSVEDVAGMSARDGDTLLLHVVRGNSALFLVIR